MSINTNVILITDLSMLSPVLAYYLNFCSFVGMGEVKQQCIHSGGG